MDVWASENWTLCSAAAYRERVLRHLAVHFGRHCRRWGCHHFKRQRVPWMLRQSDPAVSKGARDVSWNDSGAVRPMTSLDHLCQTHPTSHGRPGAVSLQRSNAHGPT